MEVNFADRYELLIPGLRLWIFLGCSVEERSHLQPVDIDIRINFSKEPVGCHSDELEHVSCYKTIVDQVVEYTDKKTFNLIEYLAAQIFQVVGKQLNDRDAWLEIVIAKPNHPIPHVGKAVVFRYSGRSPQKSL